MNKVILSGRLTRDPDVRQTSGENPTAVARYTLAVDRRFKKDGEQGADFIPCIVFGKGAEFTDKYLRQGTKMIVIGHLQTGSYTNKDGVKVYTTEVVVEDQEFAESKNAAGGNEGGYNNGGYNNSGFGGGMPVASGAAEGFMNIPDGIDEELPFN